MPRVVRRVVLEVEALNHWILTSKLLDIFVLSALTTNDVVRPRVLKSSKEVISGLAKKSVLA